MLPTDYQQFIHLSRYARWNEDEARRETWPETVDRYFEFFVPHLNARGAGLQVGDISPLRDAIHDLDVMPSMRCMMTAGPALARDHIAGYNCAYRPIDDVRAFDEILFVLMCSTGVGFSVERQYTNQLPALPESLSDSGQVITVRDSKRGWAEAFRELLGLLYVGRIPGWDTSKVRKKGALLKTMGGRASGPEPLVELFEFTVHLFKAAIDNGLARLSSIQCHDLVCKIGECVVVGGVRRSALISLSNLSDMRMRDAKAGEWYILEPQRRLANNSVAYTETPEVGQYMEEWLSLVRSKSGERGIFNRVAAVEQAMKSGRRQGYKANGETQVPWDFGTNPCGEIILRPKEFCNLSTIVVRPEDDPASLEEKVKLATILGTWQATLTNFRYLTRAWQRNCEEERLLGVSMTGIMTNRHLNQMRGMAALLEHLRQVAIDTNKEWAERLGIPQSAAATCIKPEGTVSQLVNTTSGINTAFARHYLRAVRQDKKDPLTQFLMDQGVPHEEDVMNKENMVFSFPMTSPKQAIMRDDLTAIETLEHWKVFREHWCEHNPSITVNVKEKEWPGVGAWVWDHFDAATGLTFMPHSDHIYKQAPYQAITANVYEVVQSKMPQIDWSELASYEKEDVTGGHRELACTAGVCEL